DQPAVLRVEGDLGRALGQEGLHARLRALVDLEGDVAALRGTRMGAPGVCAEVGQHLLAQGRGQVRDQCSYGRLRHQAGTLPARSSDPDDRGRVPYWFTSAGREPSVTSTWAWWPPRMMSSLTVSPGLWAAISSERSLFWRTGLSSTAITRSPPVFTCWSWKV